MTKMIPLALFMVLMTVSCGCEKQPETDVSSSPVGDFPVVNTTGYKPFSILMMGDSYCGTISTNPQILFDCGRLAGAYADKQDGKRDGRCIVERTKESVIATILSPPDGQKFDYYPINVFSPNQDVKEDEVKRLAFEIEKAVLRK
jgi:hypothetical protein